MQKSQNEGLKREWLPARIIALSFFLVICTGTFLLWLPISAKPGQVTTFMDAAFTATSATCVTGLVTVDTATHWSVFGQIVIMLLIQVGGLGLVTLVSFFNVMIKKRIGLRSMQLAGESISTTDFKDVYSLLKFIVTFSLSVESIGAVFLMMTLVPKYGLRGIFFSVFLSVSSFCNAGFDPFGFEEPFCSLVGFYQSPMLLCTIAGLIIIGGMGFGVWSNVLSYKRTNHLSLHTKLVIISTLGLIIGGGLFIMLLEWHNPATMGYMTGEEKIYNALFLSVSSRTAGFNSFDLAAMSAPTKLFVCLLMFIGAAPGSTGGGIKITTAVVLISTVWCALRGQGEVYILKHQIKKSTVYKSLAICTVAGLVCIVASVGASFSAEYMGIPHWGIDAFFEAVSAFGTVGLSVGVTGGASILGKCALILTMFIGRVGPVSFALALASAPRPKKNVIMPEGKIMVG